MTEGGSAGRRANELRQQAAAARARASALDHEAGAWEAGALGERLAAAELTRLPSPWRVLNDRLLRPGRSQVNLDHIAVGPPGVFLIDSKHWSGRITVYDGTLWQHNGTHRPQRRALEQVSRAAAELEQVLGIPVVPILSLTGSSGESFAPCRVGGVDVVSLRALPAWLKHQLVMIDGLEIDATVRRIELAFPPATSASSSSELSAFDGTPAPAGNASASHGRRAGPQKRSWLRGTRAHALTKLIVGLAVLALAPVVLPIVANRVSGAVPTVTRPIGPTTSCRSLSSEQVSVVLGARVTPGGAQSDDRCSWHLSDTGSSAAPVVTLQVLSGSFTGRSTGQGKATAQAGRAFIRVPQGESLTGWAAPRPTAPAAFAVNLRYSYPPKATRADRQKADDTARAKVTTLAEAFARSAMPGR